jgi:hypothetical protein
MDSSLKLGICTLPSNLQHCVQGSQTMPSSVEPSDRNLESTIGSPAISTQVKCSILQLPNELLDCIFTYIRLDETTSVLTRYPPSPTSRTFICLAVVCSRFRRVVFESSIWFDETFCFESLFSRYPFRRHTCFGDTAALRELLSDPSFVVTVGTKDGLGHFLS